MKNKIIIYTVLLALAIISIAVYTKSNQGNSSQSNLNADAWNSVAMKKKYQDAVTVSMLFLDAFFNQNSKLGNNIIQKHSLNNVLWMMGDKTPEFQKKLQADLLTGRFEVVPDESVIQFSDGYKMNVKNDNENCVVVMIIHDKPAHFISLKKINGFWLVAASHLTKAMMDDPHIARRVLTNAIEAEFN